LKTEIHLTGPALKKNQFLPQETTHCPHYKEQTATAVYEKNRCLFWYSKQ